MSIGAYHQYCFGDRWAADSPRLADGEVDWLARDEWFAYDLAFEPGSHTM